MRLTARNLTLGLIAALALMQLIVPARTNPPSDPAQSLRVARPDATHALDVMTRSCRDCHSNDTTWPWYSRVAPVSWVVVHDVNDGRRELNMSEFGTYNAKRQQRKLEEACQQVTKGEMPMWSYTVMHPQAKLQPGDVEAICSLAKPAS
jgi:hypothetical protein